MILRAARGKPMSALEAMPAKPRASSWLWIDLQGAAPEDLSAAVAAIGADPTVLETIREGSYPAWRSVGESTIALVTRSLSATGERVTTTPVIVVLARGGVLTVRSQELPGIAFALERAQHEPAFAPAPDILVARLLDLGAQRFAPLTDELDASIGTLEERAIEGDPNVLTDSHAMRRDAWALRGVLRAQREMLRAVLRSPAPLLGPAARRLLEDAYDLHVRVVESLETARMMLSGVIELYRSAVAERTNEVMKVLTVFAAIMLPLSLIAGIYGMNFENIPELRTRWGYFGVISFMALIALGEWLYFARRGFIGGPKRARAVGRGLVHVAFLPIKTVTVVTRTLADAVLPGDKPER